MNDTDQQTRRMAQVDQVLGLMGNTHSLADVTDMINAGTMQSFTDGDTWVVTQILDYPQKRVLEIFLVVGTLDGAHGIKQQVLDFAKKSGCQMVRAFGRQGWRAQMRPGDGWRGGMQVYIKEL